MNHDDHKPDLSTLIDPELEARIVAWVSGEASPFETAELARLTNEKPELAIFHRRIAAVSGLVGEAIRPDKEPLRLAPERRTKLLRALGAAEFKPDSANATNTVVLPLAATKKRNRINRRWIYGLAACLTVGLFTVMSIPSFQMTNSFKLGKSFNRESGREKPALFELAMPLASDPSSEAISADSSPLKAQSRKTADYKNREIAYARAISEAEKRKLERSEIERIAGARLEAAQQKAELDDLAAARARNRPATLSLPRVTTGVALPLPPPPGTNIDARAADFNYAASPANAPSPSLGFVGQPVAGEKKIAAKEEQIVLSPFTVEAKGDAGYAASNTLASKRIRTELRDLSSTLSVHTNQFLKDTAATSGQKLLPYTPSSEVGGVYGDVVAPKVNRMAGAGGRLIDHFNSLTIDPTSAANVGDDKVDQSIDGPKITVEENAEAITADALPAPDPVRPPAQTSSEINAAKEPVSTFSLHVSDVSFRLAQAALAKGEELDKASIRPEEFYNAFSYGDPTPALAEKVSCRIEQAAHPFVQQRNLVRIAVKVASSGRDAAQPLHLTVLLDTSGSMEREDRAATIQSAMKALTSLLGPNDRLTLIGFSRQPRLLAEALSGDQAAQVLDLIKNTPAEGGTNLEEALKLGSELARRQFNATAQNRIVLLTDGAANLGNANPAQLAASIEALRQQGIAFDACGVGLEGLDDGMLENLTRKGDGRYYVLNSPEAADAGFAKQLAGAFRPAAENVKLQVRFNPARVGNYRLIGFEQHRLNEEDFRNDKVDAAELAAEEAAVAVYQVEALPQGEGELGEVYVRFRDTASGNMVERSWTLNYDPQTPAFDRATPSIQLAGTAALLAEKLQGGEAAAAINLGDLAPIVAKLRNHYAHEPRVKELVTMFEQARKLAGE